MMTQQAIARMGGQADNMDYYLWAATGGKGCNRPETEARGWSSPVPSQARGRLIVGAASRWHFLCLLQGSPGKNPDVESKPKGRRYEAVVKNRMVLMAVPLGREELYPRFYGADGREIIPNLRVAFVCGAEPPCLVPVRWPVNGG